MDKFTQEEFGDKLHWMMEAMQDDYRQGRRRFLKWQCRAGRRIVTISTCPDMLFITIGDGMSSFVLEYKGKGWTAQEYYAGGGLERQGLQAILRWIVYSTLKYKTGSFFLSGMPKTQGVEIDAFVPMDTGRGVEQDETGWGAYAPAMEEASDGQV